MGKPHTAACLLQTYLLWTIIVYMYILLKYWKSWSTLSATNLISKTLAPTEISISHTQIRVLQAPQSPRTFVPHEEHTENAVEDYFCKVMKKDRPRYGNCDNQWVVWSRDYWGVISNLRRIWYPGNPLNWIPFPCASASVRKREDDSYIFTIILNAY